MGATGPWETVFWYVSLIPKVGLLGRLLWLRVAGKYPALSTFLVLQVLRTLWLLRLNVATDEYHLAFVVTEPMLIVSRAFVVFELYGKILESYRGLSLVSRGTMATVLLVSLGVSLALHAGEFGVRAEISVALGWVHLFESTVYSALLLYILVLAGFMLWFRAPVRRNLLVHTWGFCLYFVISGAMVYLRQLNVADWGRLSSSWRIAAANLIMMVWIVLLTKDGEKAPCGSPGGLPEDGRQRLLKQLEDINQALERKRR